MKHTNLIIIILQLHLAFSRDQPEKQYVTHLLEKNADELWNIIGVKNGHIYVCGYVFNCFDFKLILCYFFLNVLFLF